MFNVDFFRRALCALLLLGGGPAAALAAPPFHGSLFTAVDENTAIGPATPKPVALYPYEPRELHALTDVASNVRAAVAEHLIARVGQAFYDRLTFAGGEAVNLAELHRVLPASRKLAQEVPTYLLWYEFAMPEVGIRVYTASIALRGDGSVVREIDLPVFARDPAKLRFVPLAKVTAGLVARGLIDTRMTAVTLAYDARHAQILWHYERVLPGAGPLVNIRNVDVNANTGVVLRRYTDHGGP